MHWLASSSTVPRNDQFRRVRRTYRDPRRESGSRIAEARGTYRPVPVKTAVKLMGKITGEVRQPLCLMSAANEDKLRQVMQKYGLIK